MQMVVGFKLVDANANEIMSWGGTWGQRPGIPNPIRLPNGDHIHAPSIDTDYSGFMLVEWMMDEPAPSVPKSINPRQVRTVLLQQGLLEKVEEMISQQDKATQIAWQYAPEFQRDDPLLMALAANLGLTDEQLDQFFIAAAHI